MLTKENKLDFSYSSDSSIKEFNDKYPQKIANRMRI